jgi:hypothetical protein
VQNWHSARILLQFWEFSCKAGGTYQNIVTAMAGIETRISENNELAKIYMDGCIGATELSGIELIRFNELISSLMNLLENLFYQYNKGLLERDMWEGWSSYLIHLVEKPGVSKWWEKYNKYFSKNFRDYIAIKRTQTTNPS